MTAAAADTTALEVTLESLRERIRKLQAAPRRYLAALRTGVAALDGLLPGGGFPLGTTVELCGDAASGRATLALRAVAAAQAERRLAAWVDGPSELYPPAAAAVGVDLSRLLIVRPPAPRQLVWAAQQLGRSGAFACVVLDLTHTGVRPSLSDTRKLHDAAVHGGALVLLLTSSEAPADAALRLRLSAAEGAAAGAAEIAVLRSRGGGAGGRARLEAQALLPGGAPVLRQVPPSGPLPAAPLTPENDGPSEAPFRRVRTSDVRNGVWGLHRQRPGRDVRMPALGPLLAPRPGR